MTNGHENTALSTWRSTRPSPQTPTIRVVKASAADLNAHWGFIRQRLLALKAKMLRKNPKTELLWTPEQVRWGVMRGFAGRSSTELFLVLGPDGDKEEIKAFFVTTCDLHPFLNCPHEFFLWLVWSGYPKVREAVMPHIEALARERGCVRIKGLSPFEGYFRVATKMGFTMEHVVWVKEVN